MGLDDTPRHPGTAWSPRSTIGDWSVLLAGLAVTGTVALWLAFRMGVQPGANFGDHPAIDTAGAAVLATAAAAVVTGILALARHDRTWAVIASVVVGALLSALMLQQVAEGLGWLAG